LKDNLLKPGAAQLIHVPMKIGTDFPKTFASDEALKTLTGLIGVVEIQVVQNLQRQRNQNEANLDVWSFWYALNQPHNAAKENRQSGMSYRKFFCDLENV
jgi:hypothetical protein